MAATVYENTSNEEAGNLAVAGRLIPLKEVYMLRVCSGTKLYIVYKERPIEKIIMTEAELVEVLKGVPKYGA